MNIQNMQQLGPHIKLEILKRIIQGDPVSPMIDKFNPHDITQIHRFVLEKAIDFGKAIKGPGFSSKDITRHLQPLNIEQISSNKSIPKDKNLLAALELTRKQIDIIVKIAHQLTKHID